MACDCDCGKTPTADDATADRKARVVFNLMPGTPFPRELETAIFQMAVRGAFRTNGGNVQTVLGR